ncbi:IPT/TIG domain-containing protein [Agromyces soli]
MLAAGGGALSAQAAPGDDSYAAGQFLSGSLLDLMNLDAVVGIDGETATSSGVTPETNSGTLGLGVLGAINVALPGGLQLPVDFANAGVVGQYAHADVDASSIGASGLISDAGAIGTGVTPAPGVAPGPMTFDLSDLLGAGFTGAITDLDLALGVMSANAQVVNAGAPVGDYEIQSAGLVIDSPVVEGVTGTVTSAVGTLQSDVDALAGSNGALVNGVLDTVDGLLAGVGLGTATATVDVDLQAALGSLLTTPLDSGNGVVIDLGAGTITVDLEQFAGLNGLAPNTELLSTAVLQAISAEVAALIDGLVQDIETAVTNALDAATVSVDVVLTAPVVGTDLVHITVDGTLATISDKTATVGITALGVPIVGLDADAVLSGLKPIVDGVIDPVTGSLGTFFTTLNDDVVVPVTDILNPAIELLDEVVSLLANVQEPTPPVAGQVFTETALRLSLLPTAILPQLLVLDLAKATVGPDALVGPPVIASLTPNQGPTAGGTAVTISGTDLDGATDVLVDGVSVGAGNWTQGPGTDIVWTTTAHDPGTVQVQVVTPQGTSNEMPFTFVPPAPVIAALTPDQGPTAGGTPVTISGTDLTFATDVLVDGASVSGSAGALGSWTQSGPNVIWTTAAHATGPVQVQVVTPGGTSNQMAYTFVPPAPGLLSLTPPQGTTAGGTAVTISGTDLTGATDVTIDGVSVSGSGGALGSWAQSGADVVWTTAPHAAGPVQVRVVTPGGTSNAMTYTFVEPLDLVALTPDHGPETGGTSVTISGDGLETVDSVTVDGATVAITHNPDGTISFTTPAHAPGTVNVVVTNALGIDSLPFTFDPVTKITGVSPASGPEAGTNVVTITGSCFTGASAVLFGSTPATAFTVVNDTTITATVPAGTGVVDVVVTGGGTCGTGTLDDGYAYVPAPLLSSLSPTQGPTAGGTPVTITGTDLAGATDVTIDGVSVGAGNWSQVDATHVSFTTPAHAAGPVAVRVVTVGGTSNALTYTYIPPAPVIAELSPDEGPAVGGTFVTVTGTNLAGATGLTVDGVPTPFAEIAGVVTFVTPPHLPGPALVQVTTLGGPSNVMPFTYFAAPAIASLSPTQGTTLGGTVVTITGTALAGATDVTIDGASVTGSGGALGTWAQVDATHLTWTTAAHVAGPVAVRVMTAGGTSAPMTYTFVEPVDLAALTPDHGPETGGTPVTITGTGLGTTTGVTVDGASVPFIVVDAGTVTIQTPPHAPGAVSVVVTNPIGSDSLPFTYEAVTKIDEVSPPSGPEAGGTTVTITGSCFTGATAVLFGSTPATSFTVVSDTEITAVVPAGTGVVDVSVTGGGTCGTGTIDDGYTYVPAPVAVSLAPSSGPASGGTAVVVTGTNLAGATGLTVDGVSVPFTQLSATQLSFTTPPHAVGPVPVVVTTVGGASAPLTFTYTPAAIDTVTPPSGPAGGGTQVTISGRCFTGATAVRFGSTPATSFRVVDDGTIVAVAPAGTGVVDVTVVGAGACGTATLPKAFTYVAAGIASTGVDPVPVALGGLAVLLIGAAAFAAGMGRRTRRA